MLSTQTRAEEIETSWGRVLNCELVCGSSLRLTLAQLTFPLPGKVSGVNKVPASIQ
jgi:hypothetical protein